MLERLKRARRFNSSRERLLQENTAFARLVPAGSYVLDAGAGNSPYRHLFAHAKYESADFGQVENKKYSRHDYVCDLSRIPVEDGRFDFIIFNQVMEHLPEPRDVLRELCRVLKPGGRMIYTGPLFYEEHEQPYDFYRYTQFGVSHLAASAGFKIERLEWMEGYFGTLGYQFAGAAELLPRNPSDYGGGVVGILAAALGSILKLTFVPLAIIFHRLEMRHKLVSRGYPKNYVAVLLKSAP